MALMQFCQPVRNRRPSRSASPWGLSFGGRALPPQEGPVHEVVKRKPATVHPAPRESPEGSGVGRLAFSSQDVSRASSRAGTTTVPESTPPATDHKDL